MDYKILNSINVNFFFEKDILTIGFFFFSLI